MAGALTWGALELKAVRAGLSRLRKEEPLRTRQHHIERSEAH